LTTTYFSLNKNLDGNKIIEAIQKIVNIANTENPNTNKVLKISIETIASETNELIPKLEYKQIGV
jgi:hypothetical protein